LASKKQSLFSDGQRFPLKEYIIEDN
jgi:hypothetical protein